MRTNFTLSGGQKRKVKKHWIKYAVVKEEKFFREAFGTHSLKMAYREAKSSHVSHSEFFTGSNSL
jgi:hypothetical protein